MTEQEINSLNPTSSPMKLYEYVKELRAELEKKDELINSLQELHYLDLSEIAYQRRQIDFLMESMAPKKREVCNNCNNFRSNIARPWCVVKNIPVDYTCHCSRWEGANDD